MSVLSSLDVARVSGFLDQGLADCGSQTKSSSLPVFISIVLLEPSKAIYIFSMAAFAL